MNKSRYGKIQEVFAIDYRSLAVFRIILAAMLLFDLAIRFPDISAHYTDEGVLPREALFKYFPQNATLCLHLLTGSWIGQVLIFFIHAVAAAMLFVGKKTRTCAFVCWLFLISLQSRNELLLHGGDHYLRILFFWAMFLPLNGCWAIDKSGRGQKQKTISSIATGCLIIQMAVVYWFSAALKVGPEWTSNHSALYYALNISYFKLPFGQYLLQFPSFLKLLTQGSLWLEWMGPFFFFLPMNFYQTRILVIAFFIFFHLGVAATIYLGSLPYVFLIPLIVLVPSKLWDKLNQNIEHALSYIGKFQSLKVNPKLNIWARSIGKTFAGFVIVALGVYQLMENFETTTKKHWIPANLRWIASTLRIDQDWGMFAPFPYKIHGWFIVEGYGPSGEHIQILDREPASSNENDRPSVPALHRNGHWLSYSILTYTEHREQLEQFGNYLCKKWNKEMRQPPLSNVRISFMRMITPPEPDIMTPHKENLLAVNCEQSEEEFHVR